MVDRLLDSGLLLLQLDGLQLSLQGFHLEIQVVAEVLFVKLLLVEFLLQGVLLVF